jgi:hypothetical protein
MVINVLSLHQQRQENTLLLVNTVGKTMSTVFPSIYKIEMFLNHLLFASRTRIDLSTIRERLKSYDGDPELNDAIHEASLDLSPLYVSKDGIVLTDDKSPVDELTYRMVSGFSSYH